MAEWTAVLALETMELAGTVLGMYKWSVEDGSHIARARLSLPHHYHRQ